MYRENVHVVGNKQVFIAIESKAERSHDERLFGDVNTVPLHVQREADDDGLRIVGNVIGFFTKRTAIAGAGNEQTIPSLVESNASGTDTIGPFPHAKTQARDGVELEDFVSNPRSYINTLIVWRHHHAVR